MSKITESSYVSLLNNAYKTITSKIPDVIREKLIGLLFIIFAAYFILLRSDMFYQKWLKEQDICQFFGAVLLILVTFMSIKGEIKAVSWRKSLVIPYYLFALGLVGIGLMHPIGGGYGFFGLMMLTVYPCLYLTWNNRDDYEVLFDNISVAFMIIGTFYFIWFAVADYYNTEVLIGDRHEGGMYNANFLSFIGVSLSCVALYFLYRCLTKDGKKSIITISYSSITIIMGVVLSIKGGSRSALLIFGVNTLIIVFFIIKKGVVVDNNERKKHMTPITIIIFAVVIAAIIFGAKHHMLFLERFDFSNQSVDQYSSGRIGLWRGYAQHLNLLGHDMSSVDWNALTGGMNTRHAHNNFLDFSYRSGIIVGICCIAFQLVAGILTLIMMFKKGINRDYEVFVVLFTVHFLVLSLIDIATLPMTNYAAFFFYICVAPLFVSNRDREQDIQK